MTQTLRQNRIEEKILIIFIKNNFEQISRFNKIFLICSFQDTPRALLTIQNE